MDVWAAERVALTAGGSGAVWGVSLYRESVVFVYGEWTSDALLRGNFVVLGMLFCCGIPYVCNG